MYHVKSDRRAQRSADLIYAGLSSLLENKPYDDITITDIQKASGVGRATFYRNFDTKSDVLYWQCALKYDTVVKGYLAERERTGNEDIYVFLACFFDYWMHDENSRILEQLIQIDRYDIIYKCQFESSLMIKSHVTPQSALMEKYYTYYMSGLIGAFVGFLITWVKNGKQLSAKELSGILKAMQSENPSGLIL